MALAGQRDKEAVPVLIDLLAKLNRRECGQVEEFLARLAGEAAPAPVSGTDESSRKKQAAAWLAWWREAGPKLDPARLAEVSRTLHYTLVVLLDEGRIIDLDSRNRRRWQIDHLVFPLDAQLLPGDRVLVAEHHANRVTERSSKGQLLWEKGV